MAKKNVNLDKEIEPVWGPSVPHSWGCRENYEATGLCTCPKRNYCEACDAMHTGKQHCPRSVLDEMRDALFYKSEINHDRLVAEILDSVEARRLAGNYWSSDHIKQRIDELAERHGNLGITRKKLVNLVKKEERRRWRRATRRNTPRRWRKHR